MAAGSALVGQSLMELLRYLPLMLVLLSAYPASVWARRKASSRTHFWLGTLYICLVAWSLMWSQDSLNAAALVGVPVVAAMGSWSIIMRKRAREAVAQAVRKAQEREGRP